MIDINISLDTETLYSTEPSSSWGSFRDLSATTCAQIRQRIEEVGQLLEKFRPAAIQSQVFNLPGTIPSNLISSIGEGISGSYFLKGLDGGNRYVIKPIDEDAGCINNPKDFWGASLSSPVRDDMPLYLSSLKEAATYEIASSVGLTSIAPKTALAIFESETFFYLVDALAKDSSSSKNIEFLLEEVPSFSREKLCSVQEFVPNAKDLFSLAYTGMGYFNLPSELLAIENAGETKINQLIIKYLHAIIPKTGETEALEREKQRALAWISLQNKSICSSAETSYSNANALAELKNILWLFELAKDQADETDFNLLKKLIKLLNLEIEEVLLHSNTDGEILLDQSQYEDLVTLIWLTYDTDAHLGNILGCPIDTTEDGIPIYGLKKIDNGLTFPTKNQSLRNPAIYFSNAEKPLSQEGRKKIQEMDEVKLVEILKNYDLDIAVPAFEERLHLLKSLVEKPDITLKEINSNMEALQYENSFSSSWSSFWNSSW